jgi:hypothetical protein
VENSLEPERPGEDKNSMLAGFVGGYSMQWRLGE